MSDHEFPRALREEARRLAFRPENEFVLPRLAARIRERVQSRPTVLSVLSRWLAPVAAALLVLTLAAGGVSFWEQGASSSPADLAMVADAGLLHEDFYRAAQ